MNKNTLKRLAAAIPILAVLCVFYLWHYNLNNKTNMELKSGVFTNNDSFPEKYTCDEENVSPPLMVSGVPDGAKSLVLIMDDPDATGGGTFDHWILWNVPPETAEIKEGNAPAGAMQGATGFGKSEYGGPCPPKGSHAHRYAFKLYALDILLDLPAGSAKAAVEKSMKGHVLAETVLTGLYSR